MIFVKMALSISKKRMMKGAQNVSALAEPPGVLVRLSTKIR